MRNLGSVNLPKVTEKEGAPQRFMPGSFRSQLTFSKWVQDQGHAPAWGCIASSHLLPCRTACYTEAWFQGSYFMWVFYVDSCQYRGPIFFFLEVIRLGLRSTCVCVHACVYTCVHAHMVLSAHLSRAALNYCLLEKNNIAAWCQAD